MKFDVMSKIIVLLKNLQDKNFLLFSTDYSFMNGKYRLFTYLETLITIAG